ncbi:MAG: hypothetical protein MUF85_00820 [Patescibacteria group bacterium]|jgi:hypothetical protein|nr:hypothetical protein [Patescibacteria group bacterium]
MYNVDKTRSRKKLLSQILIILLIILGIILVIVWYFFLRSEGLKTTNFEKSGGNTQAVVAPALEEFTTDEFKLSLPKGWELIGKQNPYYNQVYYEFQSKIKDYENRWLKVFVDVIPEDYALNKVMPITVMGNRLKAGEISDDCNTFSGAPKPGSSQSSSVTWKAEWEGISFICNVSSQLNQIGSGVVNGNNIITVTGPIRGTHKYMLIYTDHNVRPDQSIFTDAVNSFEAI